MSELSIPTLQLEEFLPYRLARAAEKVSQDFAKIYKDHAGLTRPQWRTLATLGQFGRVTASFIGTHSSMHKTKVSRAIVDLEKRGWIKRQTDEKDRRSELIELKPEGQRHYKNLVKEAHKFEQNLMSNLGQQNTEALIKALQVLT